jgi:hypothetical protein
MIARVGAVAAACVAVALAGCGSGGGSGDGGWGQRADAICDRTEKALRAMEPPEDIGDLDRVMVRASEEIRAAIGEIRKLEISESERRRVQPVLDDLELVEQHLDRIADATGTGDRRPIFKAGRRLRLDAVDFGAHAEQAGLTRCGREEVGIAAADAVLAPPFAESVAEDHARFIAAERAIARRHSPSGAARERATYWVALWELVKRTADNYVEPPEGHLPAVTDYWDAYHEMRDRADYFSSVVKGEIPVTGEKFTEAQARRGVRAFEAAGFTLLEKLGPAGEAQLRILQGGGPAEGAGPKGQES